ncbi:CubicO group peptidase (beta-lactamase class C family) [Sphingomonas leidyi]|uniref:CubicO group peptidase (Beta-lactamase class C family) n=1 Tax=Sphingomonas leidyi TaxID=68569 RepID=A0A7X5V2W8_9SPHN|nr:serine hydrolase domain-containing protein [Sphingomonas leidyi]NIJ66788.1 CubicO group peptidase (beta-lactamase class C family) [Sphingomonas leidyi]
MKHWMARRMIPALAIAGLAAQPVAARDVTPAAAKLDAAMERWMPDIVRAEKIGGIGIAVIRDGRLIWSGHYGEQAPGVPTSADTAFNTASIAKTVTAETLLALAAARRIDLDEPIAGYVRSPGLDGDPRYKLLTTRILLSHRSGLRNWADDYPDGRLAFDWEPGTRYRYSGAGIELAARYAQARTGMTLRALAAETVLRPWGIAHMAVGELPDWTAGRLALPMGADGRFLDLASLYPGLREGTGLGAAYDLIATTGAYGAFLERLIAASRPGSRPESGTRDIREKIVTPLAGDARYGCEPRFTRRCPDRYGYAFGWQVQRYGRHTVLQHTGNDEGETDLVYFSPDRRTGAAIFVNGANGWVPIVRALEIIGDEPELAGYYRGLVEKLLQRRLEALPRKAGAGRGSPG